MELWTKEHFLQLIPTEIAMIIVAIILNKLIGKKTLKIRMIPFQILAVLLLLSEVGKQVLSFKQGYDLYHIPLHVCSLFIPLLPLMAFYNGRYRDVVRTLTCTVTTAMVLFMVIYPNLIYGAGNIRNFFGSYWDFHTVFYHNIVIFEFILIIALRLHHVGEKRYVKHVALMGAGFSAAAGVASNVLQVNYAKFLNCNDVPPAAALVNSIKGAVGDALGQIIYVIALGILHILFFLGCYYLYRAIDKLNIRLRGKSDN